LVGVRRGGIGIVVVLKDVIGTKLETSLHTEETLRVGAVLTCTYSPVAGVPQSGKLCISQPLADKKVGQPMCIRKEGSHDIDTGRLFI